MSDPHDNGIQKHGKVDHTPLSHAPRSSEARALPLPARTKTSRMSIVARWRHPFRQASFIVAVATLAAVSPTSPPSLSGPFMMQAQPTPLAPIPMPTCPVCSPVRRCLCCRPAVRALLAAFAAAASLSARHCCLRSYGGAIAVLVLSPGVSSKLPCRDVAPSPPSPPLPLLTSPISAELHAARFSPLVPGARCVCLIVVGALAPR